MQIAIVASVVLLTLLVLWLRPIQTYVLWKMQRLNRELDELFSNKE